MNNLLTDKRQNLELDIKEYFAQQMEKYHAHHNTGVDNPLQTGLPIPNEASHVVTTESYGQYNVATVYREGVDLWVQGEGTIYEPMFYEWSELFEYQIFAVLEMVESIQYALFPTAE